GGGGVAGSDGGSGSSGGAVGGGTDGGIVGGSCVDAGSPCGSVRLQYQSLDPTKPNDTWIKLQINVINQSGVDLPLSEVTVRYWYTIDSGAPQSFGCDAALVGPNGCADIRGTFTAVSPPRAGADWYLE